MKKLLFLLPLLTIISCSPERVQIDDTQPERVHIDDIQVNTEAKMLFYQGKPFTGIAYNVYSNGQLKFEGTYKDGKRNGLFQKWYENGQLKFEGTYKDGKRYGLHRKWHESGQLKFEGTYNDGMRTYY